MLVVQLLAVGLTTHTAPSRTALLSMGLHASILRIVVVGTIIFHIVMFTLVPRIGAMGANIAHVVLALICAVGFGVTLRRALKQVRAQAAVEVSGGA